MSKRVLSLFLIGLLINVIGFTAVNAQTQSDKQTRAIEQIRENVRKLGVGEDARIEIKLLDGKKIKGYIREANEDDFIVVDAKTNSAVTIDYSQVKKIKGKNRSTAAKVGLEVVKGVVVFAIVGAIATVAAAILVTVLLKPRN